MTEIAQRTPMEEVCAKVSSAAFGKVIAQALPPNVSLDTFTRVTLTAIQANPELITVDRQTLYSSIVRCAQDGLRPDGREAALVVFNDKKKGTVAQYMPMIGGLRKVLAEHGLQLTAQIVMENDEFDYRLGDTTSVTHRPPKLGKPRGEIIGAYAIIRDNDGKMVGDPEVMARAEIETIRAISRSSTSPYGPWTRHYGEMCRKTVARRAFKQAPLGPLTERQTSLLQAADAEFEFEQPARTMTVEEANLSSTLNAQAPPSATTVGPHDVIEAEPVDEREEESFEERAERAQRERAARAAS